MFRDRAGDRAEVFAYGALGYGTLQEAMVAMDWAPALRPDWVIVQATGNDLINNSFALEIDSYGSNNNKRRPYLVSTSTTSQEWAISRRVPKPWPGLHEFAFDHSRMLYYLLSRADRLLLDPAELTTEREIRERGLSWPSFKSASDTTAAILRRLKQQTQPARVAVFIVDADEPYVTAFRRACAAADVAFTTAAAEAIHEAETQGRIVRGFDRVHWNELGHQVAAEALVTFFREASSELGLPGAP
ncbi:MAG: hypothetical protein P9L99_02460 [Candidatus Lernaella stagnicola]|nr:hypothetical protein [Candidatus Lernaella stagnicola]